MQAMRLWVALVAALAACQKPEERPAAPAASTAVANDPVTAGRAFVTQLGRGDYDGAVRAFTADVARALNAAALRSAWEQSMGALGPFQEVESARAEKQAVVVRARLAKGTLDVHLVFSGDKIGGLHFDVAESRYQPPPYVDSTLFEAREVTVGAGETGLPGTFLLPKGAGPFPAIVLVHGSGPGDRDDSIGLMRPFRDLAEGLASRGIAVLRWEKRTHGHLPALHVRPADITVNQEYLDDVAAALGLARATVGIDPKRLYVLGHSQGGWLTPWILKLHRDVAGGILFAGHARWFADLIPPQIEYLAKQNDGQIDAMEQAQIDATKRQVARAHDPKLTPDTPSAELPLGAGAKYWLSLQPYDAVATAAALPQPLLILQGGRDYQVTEADDIALWRKGLGGKSNVEVEIYPRLNHAFVPGDKPATPEEYMTAEGHVDPKVVEDIAAWLKKH